MCKSILDLWAMTFEFTAIYDTRLAYDLRDKTQSQETYTPPYTMW